MMMTLRVIHIVLGVFWAGTLLFFVTFLEPAIRAAGPDGAKVMQAIQRRRYLDVMPVIAALTILTGIELMRRLSAGFSGIWFSTRPGMALTAGGIAALVAFVIGVVVMRPAALAAGRLGAGLNELPQGPQREERAARIQALRLRSVTAARWVAALLAVSVAAMAAARYA